ncbi:polyphosphate kinase 2 family protein [Halalkalibacter kiskunsagensis]|uniref:Polyphosphate kinase 2 family protein n=1 Tax=Halalkalibacter kiskunsagensis TaxID=1548599 RepID=A0ABV6KJ87_9BACI
MKNSVNKKPRFETKKQYNKTLKKKQLKLLRLQRALYERKVPVILIFEGWDAAGKGGAIKRVTDRLDPRGYNVHPIAAPDDHELRYHYLRRFWKLLPKKGEIGIFDRSWYGRVLVERVEGFATQEEWTRGYDEINHTEHMLVANGHIIMKFFIDISKEEQLLRFEERRADPFKRWKLTDEDWRNRQKWDQYEEAIEEMIDKTDTEFANWHVIDGHDKKTARITVIETLITEFEKRVGKLEQ